MSPARRVVIRFNQAIADALTYYKYLHPLVRSNSGRSGLLAEQFVMMLAARWEAFVHDILLAHMSNRPSAYLRSLQANIRKSISDRYGQAASRRIVFIGSYNLSPQQALALVDPRGWNITANSGDRLADKANELLTASRARRFSLTADDRLLIDCLIAVRNFVVHRSAGSRKILRDAISKIQPAGINGHLAGPLTNISRYLAFLLPSGDTRAIFLALRVTQIASQLG